MDRAEGGTFAEYAAIPAEKLAHLPEHVSWTAGGAIGNVGATAWTALEELAGIQAGDRVLIHGGAGGVGHAAVQIAAHSGAEVITTAGSEDARARLTDLGASVVLDYESDSLAEDVLAATDGAGVETVLDHRLEEYLELDLSVVTEGGTILSTMGHIPATNGRPLYNNEVTIQPLKMDNHPTRQPVLERLARLMRQDVLKPIVAETYAFEDTARAHREILSGGYVGKLVVTP
jgi:NADPH:quinone reductase-like Zn-dependent oxidoreductase